MRTEKHIIKNRYSTHGIHRNIPVYEMNTVHCSASPMEGYKSTEVTLIDDAAWNEKFSAWALTGATATGNNIVLNNDVTAQGIYETAKNITYGARTSGNKVSGFISDQVTITGTPAWNEKTSSYSITGATLTGNKFNLTGSNVTAKANFETAKNIQTNGCTVTPTSGFIGTVVTAVPNPAWNEKLSSYNTTGATHTGNNFTITGNSVVISAGFETAKNVTLQTDGHGTIAASPVSGFIGTTVTLSNTTASGYAFDYYEVIGATLNNNKFVIGYSNVTVIGHFKSATKHATVHLRLPTIADTLTESGTTWYPYLIGQTWVVVSHTGDDISELTTTGNSSRILYADGALGGYNSIERFTTGTILRRLDNVQAVVHATGDSSDWAYEVRARSNIRQDVIYLSEYNGQTEEWALHQVNPRNTQDAAGCWNYGRGQGVVAYTGPLSQWWQFDVSVGYNIDGNKYCMPNPTKSYKDVIVDLTWT